MKVSFYTLGCKLNFAESSNIANKLKLKGFEICNSEDFADVYIINTCTVTQEAEKKCRQIISKCRKLNPDAKIAVVGCFSELRAEEVRAIEGVNFVLGSANKADIVDVLCGEAASANAGGGGAEPFEAIYSSEGRTRCFFKLQDGCDNFCSFCAIPYARGRSRSATIAQTVEKAKEIASLGFKEVVFTGVNIGDFGRKNGEDFYSLVKELIKIEGVERWRLSSIEPELLKSSIIELVQKEKKLMPHFHLPLQSGSDSILKHMRRHYDTAFFKDKVWEIKSLVPEAFIAIDLIVGYPCETQADFENTYKLIEELPLSFLHIFPYSARKEAKTFGLKDVFSPQEKKARLDALQKLCAKKKYEFYSSFIGKKRLVLWENQFAYTDNYLRVRSKTGSKEINSFEEVYLENLIDDPNKGLIFECE